MVYAVTASVISAFDYPDRSIQLWLTRGVPRSMLLLSRLIVTLFFVLILVCFAVFAIPVYRFALAPRILRQCGCIQSQPERFPVRYSSCVLECAALSRADGFVRGHQPLAALRGRWDDRLWYRAQTRATNLSNRFPTLIRYLPSSLSQVLQINNFALDLSAPVLPQDAAIMPEARAVLLIGIIFIILSTISLAIFSRQDLGG